MTHSKMQVKLISIVLSLLMVLYTVPVSVFAAKRDEESNSNNESLLANSEIIEITEKRTSTDKTFRLSDGSFYIAHYNNTIHTVDENGNYADINNHLSVSNGEISTSNAKIKFAKKTTGNNNLFALHNGNTKLELSLNNSRKKIEGIINNHTTEYGEDVTQLQKMTTLDNIYASVIYNDILLNTDIEYVLSGSDIKENIIIKQKGDVYSYAFTLSLNNLTALQDDNGGISILDSSSKKQIYYIPVPVMWDANNVVSESVEMTLSDSGNGKYTIVIVADSSWMNSSDRAYPVTIDPPIYTSSTSSITDLSISSGSPSSSYSNAVYLNVGSTWQTYWKLNTLPTLPDNAYITDAQFSMNCYTSTALDGYVAVYDVLTDWDSTLTWNKVYNTSPAQGQQEEHFADFQEIYTTYYGSGAYSLNDTDGYIWNVTPIVKKWYEGNNYGLAFGPATDTSFTGTAQFRSNDYSTVSVRPQLCIKYIDMKGLEDYWSYTSQSAGFAGVGSVNNATGNLVFSIPTLTTSDALMPITPTLVYNFSLEFGEYKYPNAQTANTTSFTAKSFKLNINETLIKKSYVNESGNTAYYFIWADGDGTEHYFMTTSVSGTYTDEDGLLLTLKETSAACTITDSNGTVRSFSSCTAPSGVTSAWRLSSITDKNDNQVIYTVDASNRPTAISLKPKGISTAIVQMRLSYTSAGKLYAVWNPNSGEGVVFRYSNTYSGSIATSYGGFLRRTIRAHGGTTEAQWLAFYNTNANVSTSTITVDGAAEYTYNYLGLMSNVVNTLSQYKISYNTYASLKISAIRESSTASSLNGQKVNFTYGTSNTVIRSSGEDDIFNNSDDLLTTCCYDNYGRTVSSYTTDLNKIQIYGASNGQYVGEENEKAKNNLKSSVQTTQRSSNYLLNGGFENTANLQYWYTTGTTAKDSLLKYAGQYCASLSVNNTVSSSSVYQYVYLDKGDYSLAMQINTHQSQGVSVYLKAESMSNSAHSVIQKIPVNEYYATGSYAFAGLNFSASPAATGGQERFKITIIVTGSPSSAETVWIDNIMLSRTTGAAEYDMSSMGHFETSYSGVTPGTFWKILDNESTPISIVDSGLDTFGNVLHIDIDLDEYEFVEQNMYQATAEMKSNYTSGYYNYDNEPVMFTVSGWGKGTYQSYTGTSLFGIRAKVKYYTRTGGSNYEWFDFDFDKGITDWQFISGGFATNPDKGMIETITIEIMYNDHSGDGYFDNISLVRDSTTTDVYNYNAYGYVTEYQNGSSTCWYQYDENNNVTLAVSSKKTITAYEYDSKNRITKEYHRRYTGFFNPNNGTVSGTITDQYYNSYGYNTYGQHYYTWTYDMSNTSLQTYSVTEYNNTSGSHIFGTVANEIDALGNITRYFYNASNGRLLATIYPEGNGIAYQYDGMGNLTQVLPAQINSAQTGYTTTSGGTSVSYGYDSTTKRLSTISTNSSASSGTTYSFVYDNFGNTSGINVGSRTLASYAYNSENGKLNTLTYGNGLSVRYVYDALDRISEVKYNIGSNGAFTTVYSYTYDSAGNVFSVTDYINDEVTLYKYDATGKLMDSYVYNRNTYLNKYGTTIYYDEQSRVNMVFHSFDYSSISGTTYDSTYYSYSYNNTTGNIERLQVRGDYLSGNIDPVYDNFGRTSTKTIDFNVNDADAFYNKLTYDYKNYTGGSTVRESALVSQVVSEIRKGSGTAVLATSTLNYTYDANGNITQITNAAGTIQNKYYYDSLGQLTREDNRALNQTYVWTYDNAGNIFKKKTYAFTTGTLGTVQSTITYSYGDSTWKDLLTSYNGTTITYDTIGNPTVIGSKTLTWQGRQLKTLTNGSQTVSYGYNADGVRTNKNVYNSSTGVTTRHEYILSGSQIVKETVYSGTTELYALVYLYDEAGAPLGYRYRTPSYASGVFDAYFFEKNLQGDIIGIYSQTGTKLATYKYDAWGKVTVTYSNGGASTAAQYNPFRYRGYYYDVETSLYYLQSRYYNAEWGRFINADGQLVSGNDLTGMNLFAYCGNNPVNRIDPSGEAWWHWALAAVAVVATVATLGAAAPAAACSLTIAAMSLGASYAVASGVATVAVVATTVVAAAYVGDITYSTFSGESVLLDTVFQGNEDAYNVGLFVATMATAGMLEMAAQSPGVCFVAGTQVSTDYGSIAIENITAGMMVYAYDPDSGKTELKEVLQTFVRESNELIHINANGEQITTTPTHPFYVPEKGWIEAEQLCVGDRLQLLDGSYVIIEQVQYELLEIPVTVYNFEVEDFHTYFITDSSILVHNKCVAREGKLRADVKAGGDPNHAVGHAHIFNGSDNVASIDINGNLLAGDLKGKVAVFVRNHLSEIAEGIKKYYEGQ